MAGQSDIIEIGRTLSMYSALYGTPLGAGFRDKLSEAAQKAEQNGLDPATEQQLADMIAVTMAALKPRTLQEIRNALTNVQARATAIADMVYGSVFVFAICLLLFLILPLSVYFEQLKNCANSLQEIAKLNIMEIAKEYDIARRDQSGDKAAIEKVIKGKQEFDLHAARVATDIGFANQQVQLVFDNSRGYVGWLVAWFMPADPRGIAPSAQGKTEPNTPDVGSTNVAAAKPLPITPPASGQIPPTKAAIVVTVTEEQPSRTTDGKLSGPAPTTLQTTVDGTTSTLVQETQSLLAAVRLYSRIMDPLTALVGGSLLPLLFGFLGAAVYLLRSGLDVVIGTTSPRNIVLTAILRIGLGGVAGLAIGWFQTDAAKLTTAPFALAFLAGFSIELLFSLLDRIIAAISSSSPPRLLRRYRWITASRHSFELS
jgi:hypothetical protein